MKDSTSSSLVQNKGAVDPSQNPTSPYFLHPGENPGIIVVLLQLNGTNYHQGRKGIKNKLKFVNGRISAPNQNDAFEAWERCNGMVVSWIIRTLSPQIAQSIVYFDNTKAPWDDLRERFTKVRHGKRPVSDFFKELKILSSGALMCICNSIKTVIQQRE